MRTWIALLTAMTMGVASAHADEVTLAPETFSFDRAYGRLPKDVVPLDYEISIVPDTKRLVLRGHETVVLDVRQATDTLRFNSLDESLEQVRLDGRPVAAVASDNDQQLTTVTLARSARPGRHVLSFDYRGRIGQSPAGLFVQPYETRAGGKGLMLSTQFEATYARRMFPCWDEPAFRATFLLTMEIPAAWQAVSNMPVTRREVHGKVATVSFRRTPRMPTYLLEFSAGDLASLSGGQGRTSLNVWAVRGQEKEGAVALANAGQILRDYNDYFGVAYPLPKLDSIAVPGGFTGAMENWGAITYNERHLLMGPSSSTADRQDVYAIQAHEMAHQWFGDLVTMGWWDDIWLNESFASWMATRQTGLRHPEWNVWEYSDEEKEHAMTTDARLASHAIQQHITNELEASASFDPDITYQKGEAVLRMLEAWLGPERFRAGIRAYMKAHAYSNAATGDLWQALGAAAGQDVVAVASSWTTQAGFPVVDVVAGCAADGQRTLDLSQRRFLLGGEEGASGRWHIPLQIRSGAVAVPQPVLLDGDARSLPAGRCGEPLSINAGGVGYFRARYDDATLRATTAQFDQLAEQDRVALLDDQWAFVEQGTQELSSWLNLVQALGSRSELRPWAQAVAALGKIEYAERGTPGHQAFVTWASALLRPLAEHLGWSARPGEPAGIRQLRETVLVALGNWGDGPTVMEAQRRFAAFVADRSTLAVDDQGAVLSIAALHADAAAFERLHALARSAGNLTERRRFYGALMRVGDEALASQSAAIALSDEIPPQAASSRIGYVAELADRHPKLAWDSFSAHTDALLDSFGPNAPLALALMVPGMFWDAQPADDLAAWLHERLPAELAPLAARALESVRFRQQEKARLVPAADRYLQAAAGTH